MLNKILSLLLSFLIIFMSVAPSYAEGVARAANRYGVSRLADRPGQAEGVAQNLDRALERGIAQNLFGMAKKLSELEQIVKQLEGLDGSEIAGASVVADRATGRQEYNYGSVNMDKKAEVDAAFEHWYTEYLASHSMESLIEESYRYNFERDFDNIWLEKSKEQGIDNAEYKKVRQEAYQWYKGKYEQQYKEHASAYPQYHREQARIHFEKELKKAQSEAKAAQAQTAQDEEAYLKELIKEVWGYYYAKGYKGVLDYLAFEAMGPFELAGLLEEKERKEVREYLRNVLKEEGPYCGDVLTGKSKVNRFFYGVDPTENSIERAAQEAMEPCERALHALMPMGIFGVAAKGNDRGDAALVAQVAEGARDGIIGAGVFAVATPVLLGLNGDLELIDLLKWAPIPVSWRQDKTMRQLGFAADMLFHPVTTMIQDDARGVQNGWEANGFLQNVEGSSYNENGTVGNIFYDIASGLTKRARSGDKFSENILERVMRLNLHYKDKDAAYAATHLKMFVLGALASGYRVNIDAGKHFTTQVVKRSYTDRYHVIWEYGQIKKWHDADKQRKTEWYCGRAEQVGNGGHALLGLSQTGYVAYGMLEGLKTDETLTVEERAWVRGELAKIYNRELKACDTAYQRTQTKGLMESADGQLAKRHTYGMRYKDKYTADENRAYASKYAVSKAKAERAKVREGRARRTGKWIDVVLVGLTAVDVAVGITRAGLSALRAQLFLLRDARMLQVSGNILSKMRSVARAQRLAKYGVSSSWKLFGERLAFNAQRIKLNITPAGLRTVSEAEALAQMNLGYASYLRGAGQQAGRILSEGVPLSAWDRATALSRMDLPRVLEVPGRIKGAITGENRPLRYALRNGMYSLGDMNAVRSEGEQMLVNWARQNGKLVENRGHFFIKADEKIPGYISGVLDGQLTPKEGLRLQYATENQLQEIGTRESVRSEVQQRAFKWLEKNGYVTEHDGYLYISAKQQYPTHILEGLEGKTNLAAFEQGQLRYERVVFAQENGLLELGPRQAFGKKQISRMKRYGAVEHDGFLYAKPDAKVWSQRAYQMGLDGRATSVRPRQQVWSNVGKHEAVVSTPQGAAVRGGQAKPAVAQAKPATVEAVEADPYREQAEQMAAAAQQKAELKEAARKARLAKWDKYTFGLASRIEKWHLGRKVRNGVTTVMTAGMLTMATPGVEMAAAPVMEQTIARSSVLPVEGLLLDPFVSEKGLSGVLSLPLPHFAAQRRLLSVSEISAKLATQQKAYASFMQARQAAQLNRAGIEMLAVQRGLSPLGVKWNMGMYDLSRVFSTLKLNVQEFNLRNNVFYQAYQDDLSARMEQAAAQVKPERVQTGLQTSPLFVQGLISAPNALQLTRQAFPRVGVVLSANGLGDLTEAINASTAQRRMASLLHNYGQQAQQAVLTQLAEQGIDSRLVTAQQYADLLVQQFRTLLLNNRKLTDTQRTKLANLFEEQVKQATTTDNLFGDAVLVQVKKSVARAYFGGEKEVVVTYHDVYYGKRSFRLAEDFHFIRTASQYANPELATRKSNRIALRILDDAAPSRAALVWILASGADESVKLMAYYNLKKQGAAMPTDEEVIQVHLGLNTDSELIEALSPDEQAVLEASQRLAINENTDLMKVVPASEKLFTDGFDVSDLLQINEDKLNDVLYSAKDVVPVLNPMATKDSYGNTIYRNYLPVYLRYQDGSLSPRPLIYLTVNNKKGFSVPSGFVMAVDEKGQWKFVATNLRLTKEGSKIGYVLSKIPLLRTVLSKVPLVKELVSKRKNGRIMLQQDSEGRHELIEMNLKTSELQALLMQLRKGQGVTEDKFVAVISSNAPDRFEAMMNDVALVAGADLGASLSSQFKKTVNSSSLSILFSGFGYISPIIANWFKPLVSMYGNYRTLKVGLWTMAGVSALAATFGGMNGYFTLPAAFGWSYWPVLLFLPTAIIVASVFSTLASPILKSAYPDQVVFASKNLSFTTTKGLSRMLVGLIPAVLMLALNNEGVKTVVNSVLMTAFNTNLPDEKLNWSMLVPVVTGISLLALWNLRHSRLRTEYKAQKAEEKEKQATAGTPKENALKRIVAAYTAHDPKVAQQKQDFENIFIPKMHDIAKRLGQIYMAYAPVNSVFIGLAAGSLFDPSIALLITTAGSMFNYFARRLFNILLKNKIVTDDQLTGLLLPVMALGIVGVFAMPYATLAGTKLNWVMVLPWWLMQIATSTFGVAESSRMQNLVAQYYKDAREEVRANESLSEEDRNTQLKELKDAEAAMKLNATALYNKNNAKGILTIFVMILAGYLFTEAGWASWVAEGAASDKGLFLQVLRYSLLPSVALGGVLSMQNWDMIKDGYGHVFSPNKHLTKAIIDSGDNKAIMEAVGMNLSRVKTMQNQISSAATELLTNTRGYANSLTSEKRISDLIARAIVLNNRIKAFVDNVPNGAELVKQDLMNLRMIAYNLQVILRGNGIKDALDRVEGNDVSIYLQQKADELFKSIEGIGFASDAQVQSFIAVLKDIHDKTADDSIKTLTLRTQEYLQNMDAENFDNSFKALQSKVKDAQLAEQGKAISNLLKASIGAVQATQLNYLPELTKDLIINGTAYETALDARREMYTIFAEYQAGRLYDGILDDFERYYLQAQSALNQYMKDNEALLQGIDPRIRQMQEELDNLHDRFFQNNQPGDANAGSNKDGPIASSSGGSAYSVIDPVSALIANAVSLARRFAQKKVNGGGAALAVAGPVSATLLLAGNLVKQAYQTHQINKVIRRANREIKLDMDGLAEDMQGLSDARMKRFYVNTWVETVEDILAQEQGLSDKFKQTFLKELRTQVRQAFDTAKQTPEIAQQVNSSLDYQTGAESLNKYLPNWRAELGAKLSPIQLDMVEEAFAATDEVIFAQDNASDWQYRAMFEQNLLTFAQEEGVQFTKTERDAVLGKQSYFRKILLLADYYAFTHIFGRAPNVTAAKEESALYSRIQYVLQKGDSNDPLVQELKELEKTRVRVPKGMGSIQQGKNITGSNGIVTLSAEDKAANPAAQRDDKAQQERNLEVLFIAGDDTIAQAARLGVQQENAGNQNLADEQKSHVIFDALKQTLLGRFPLVYVQGVDVPENSFTKFLGRYYGDFWLRFLKERQLKEITEALQPGKENTLVIDAHGKVENVEGFPNRQWSVRLQGSDDDKGVNLESILRAVQQSGSAFTHITLMSCQSGQVVEDFMRIKRTHPELTEKVNIYIPVGHYQSYLAGLTPRETSSGRTQLGVSLDGLIEGIDNGQGIAGKAIIGGKVYDPLKQAIGQLKAYQRTGQLSYSERKILKELQGIRAITEASNRRDLYKAMIEFNKKFNSLEKGDRALGAFRLMSIRQGGLGSRFVTPWNFGSSFSHLPQSYLLLTWAAKNRLADFSQWLLDENIRVLISEEANDYVLSVARDMYEELWAAEEGFSAGVDASMADDALAAQGLMQSFNAAGGQVKAAALDAAPGNVLTVLGPAAEPTAQAADEAAVVGPMDYR